MKNILLLSLLLIYAVSYFSPLGITEDRTIYPLHIFNSNLNAQQILEAKSVNVSTFSVNASFYTPTLTVVDVEAYSTTVAIVQQERFDLSTYAPIALVIILTIIVIILILNKKRVSSNSQGTR